jgi:opacity protein-like surface antigen
VFTLALVYPAQAQLSVGPLVSINLATIAVDPAGTTDPSIRTAFGIGGVAAYAVNPNLSVRTQPMYLQKGSKISPSGVGDATFKLSYFELPILASYSFDLESDITPYIVVGPTIGFLMDAKVEVEDFGESDQKDETENLDLGIGIGGGVTIPRGNLNFFVEGRFNAGVVNINAEADEQEVKNRGFQLIFGFLVPIGTN